MLLRRRTKLVMTRGNDVMAMLSACSLTARKGWKEYGGREERTKTKQMVGERRKAKPYYSRSRIMANVINTHIRSVYL